MGNTANTPQNYRFLGMSSLDQKNSVKTLAELLDFTDFKPFNYYRGMIIFCHENGKYYCWTDDLENKQTLSSTNYIYPNGTIYEDINYSGKEFNFIQFNFQGPKGDQGIPGLKGDQGIPGPMGPSGNASMTNDTNEIIYTSIVPFTIQQLQSNNWILSLGVNVERLFAENICFPEFFKGKNIPTIYTIDELIKNSIINGYNLINDNSVLLNNFSALSGVSNTEKFYYIFQYILKSNIIYTAKTPIFLSINYSEQQLNLSFSVSSYIQNVVNSLGLQIKEIEIISLPNKGELNHLNQGLSINQKILYSSLTTSLLSFAPNRLDFSENNGDFLTSFVFKLIDTTGNKSNNIVVDISSSFIISNAAPNASLYWEEEGNQDDLIGILSQKEILYEASDNDGNVELLFLEKFNGTNWVTVNNNLSGGTQIIQFTLGINLFRLKAVDNNNLIGYSNVLKYTREEVLLPTATVSTNSDGTGTDDLHNADNNCYLYGLGIQTFNGSILSSAIWQYMNVSSAGPWIDSGNVIVGSGKPFVTNTEDFAFRIKVTDSNGNVGYSNELRKYYSGLPTQSYWYQGRWGGGDTVHNPENNSWVKYLDEFGNEDIFTIGPKENGCQEIVASSIIQTNGVNPCIPEQLYTYTVFLGNSLSSVFSATTPFAIVDFTSLNPSTGDTMRKYNGNPYVGSYSYVKIFNINNIQGNNKVFAATGGTGVLGSEQY